MSVNDSYYTFLFYDAGGDVYFGYGYEDADDVYELGERIDTPYGYYTITSVVDYAVDFNYQDYIEVTVYYDAQTGIYSSGTNAYGRFGDLGNEHGTVTGSNGVTDDFGYGGLVDADFGVVANDSYYTFLFYDNSGDVYFGYGYEDFDDVYALNERIDTPYGYYTITGVYDFAVDFGYQDYIEVAVYQDAQTGLYSSVTNAWGRFGDLGNEHGTATGTNGVTDEFGYGGRYDADFLAPANPGSDIHYTYHFYYNGGDYYYGYGVADASAGYYEGMQIAGTGGHYVIDSVFDLGVDNHEEGLVVVDLYYDADSKLAAEKDVRESTEGLGKESGWATASNGDTDFFGFGGSYEADFDSPAADFRDVRYEFRFNYQDGDWYTGWGYADAWQGYKAGVTFATDQGAYTITSVGAPGSDGNHQGYVEVTNYFDHETSQQATPNAAGNFGGLGWEYGTAMIANGESSDFGLGGLLEADFPGPAGLQDVYYEFTFWYLSGNDYYEGYGYTDASTGYLTGDVINTVFGFYYITSAENTGANLGREGQIGVDYYYDADANAGATTTAYGNFGELGAEYGVANGDNGNSDDFGLGGIYEADLNGTSSGTGLFDVRFDFTFYYDSGDRYSGYGYADEWEGRFAGERIDTENGYYIIDTVANQGENNSQEGFILVESYFDDDSDLTATTDAAGFFGALGWEFGSAYGPNGVVDDFGFGGLREADLTPDAGSGAEDVYYLFSFYDAGGDLYYGWGFADASDGYDEGDYLYTNYGYYVIEYLQPMGGDRGQQGYIRVDYYYDADSGLGTSTDVAGIFGVLGQEHGFAYTDQGAADGFGYGGQYDADFF